MTIKSGGDRLPLLGWTPISDSIANSVAKALSEEFFSCRKLRHGRTWGHINGTTRSTHCFLLGDSFITFILIFEQMLKRGFDKHVSLFNLDLPTLTCILIIENNIFKIWNSFKNDWCPNMCCKPKLFPSYSLSFTLKRKTLLLTWYYFLFICLFFWCILFFKI